MNPQMLAALMGMMGGGGMGGGMGGMPMVTSGRSSVPNYQMLATMLPFLRMGMGGMMGGSGGMGGPGAGGGSGMAGGSLGPQQLMALLSMLGRR